MALVETKTLTSEKNGVNAVCEFYNDFYIDKTHKDGEKIMKEIIEEFYEPLRNHYIKKSWALPKPESPLKRALP